MISTGNTKIPSYLTLLKKGYQVELEVNNGKHTWIASNGSTTHQSNDLDSLLGVVVMFEDRGVDFVASREEVLEFFKKFPELKK